MLRSRPSSYSPIRRVSLLPIFSSSCSPCSLYSVFILFSEFRFHPISTPCSLHLRDSVLTHLQCSPLTPHPSILRSHQSILCSSYSRSSVLTHSRNSVLTCGQAGGIGRRHIQGQNSWVFTVASAAAAEPAYGKFIDEAGRIEMGCAGLSNGIRVLQRQRLEYLNGEGWRTNFVLCHRARSLQLLQM